VLREVQEMILNTRRVIKRGKFLKGTTITSRGRKKSSRRSSAHRGSNQKGDYGKGGIDRKLHSTTEDSASSVLGCVEGRRDREYSSSLAQ